MLPPLTLDGNRLTLDDLEDVARGPRRVALDPLARERVERARKVVDDAVERGAVVYGVTTGFGNFADVVVPRDRLRELQANLVHSHAAGVGEALGEAETRGLMLLRANVLAKGYSGVRVETLELLIAMLNARVHPVVPSQGSVGASGDLAPLAHLALAMIGEGTCVRDGRVLRGAEALTTAGLEPVCLEAKEGIALINGTQLMTAVAGLALAEAWRLARTADVAGALTLDTLQGTDVAFDPRLAAPEISQLVDELVAYSYFDEFTRGRLEELYREFQHRIRESVALAYPSAAKARADVVVHGLLALGHAGATLAWLSFDRANYRKLRSAADALLATLED